MILGNRLHIVVRNLAIFSELLECGWTKVDAQSPKIEPSQPGVIKGRFRHPITGAEADPDPDSDWAVFVSKGAMYKRSSEFLAESALWTQLQEEARGRWLVFSNENHDILDEYDWPTTETSVLFEQDEDAVLFTLLIS